MVDRPPESPNGRLRGEEKEMKNCKLVIYCQLAVLLVLANSCRQLKELAGDVVVEQTFDSVLDIVAEELSIQNRKSTLVHWEIYPLKEKERSVDEALESEVFKPYRALLQQLKPVINDPVNSTFDNYQHKNISIFEKGPGNSPHLQDPGLSGTFNLSNSVSTGDLGCYYFALHCGNRCSKGFFVITEFEEGRWRVKEFINIWGG